MATTPKGIYYPNDYNEIADIPEDMKKMAESIEEVFEDTDSDLSDIKAEQTTQNNRLNSLEVDNTTNKSDILTNKQEINNIKTEQTTQNNRLNNLETDNTTNKDNISANTQEINNIKQEQTEQNTNISTNATNIETLQSENENLKKIVAQMPQVTGQGTEVTLENTIEAPFTKFDVEGNSTQDGTPSPDNEVPIESAGDNENLFNGSNSRNAYPSNTAGKEITWTNSSATKSYIDCVKVKQGENYTISYKPNTPASSSSRNSVIVDSNDIVLEYFSINPSQSPYTFTAQHDGDLILAMDKNTTDIQIEKGNKATPYSPYGMGSISEKIVKKNLFNKTINILDNMTINNNTMKIVADNTCKLSYLPCKPNTTYTISRSSPMSDRFWISTSENIPKIGETLLSLNMVSNSTTTAITMTTPANAHYMIIRCIKNQVDNYIDYVATIQVEYGNQATTYTSYQEQDYSIFVQQPMRSIGDVRDCFVKKSDGWYERHYIGEVVLNGTENWNYESGRFVLNFLISALDMSGRQKVYSNYFEYLPSGSAEYGIFVYKASSTNSQIYILDKDYTTVEGFKTWLSTHNVVVQYELAEPLDLPCTSEQINVLENLPSTYKDYTYVVSEDETEAYLEVSGIYDLNKLITRTEVLESEV